MLYSEKVMDHFTHPRNVGEIPDADGVGEVGNAVCGDIMKMYLKVKDGIIVDVKFKTFGCGSAIATSSMATEMIKGHSIDEALTLTNKAVVEALGGLPPAKYIAPFLLKKQLRRLLPTIINARELKKKFPVRATDAAAHVAMRKSTDTSTKRKGNNESSRAFGHERRT